MSQYICKILILILLVLIGIQIIAYAQRTQRCPTAAINKCRTSIPGPDNVFAYRTCLAINNQHRCLYNCNARNCNNYCISLRNGFNGGNCQHDIINRRTTCVCAQQQTNSGSTAPQGQGPPNNGQSGQAPLNNGPPPPPPQSNSGEERDSSD